MSSIPLLHAKLSQECGQTELSARCRRCYSIFWLSQPGTRGLWCKGCTDHWQIQEDLDRADARQVSGQIYAGQYDFDKEIADVYY